MAMDLSLLFQPLDVKGRRLRNRIVMPPMVVNRGLTGPESLAWYGDRARGGVGLVIVEATNTTDFQGLLTAENLSPLVDAIHAGGALAAIQLFPGRRGQTTQPADLSLEDIGDLRAAYGHATRVCRQAGFDGVEPHGAHGFLLNRFFSPEQNRRDDAYGGGLDNRIRLAVEIVSEVRQALGDGLLFYRHTPVAPGYGIEESLILTSALVEAGVDILDLSPSSHQAPADRAAPFKVHGVPVIAVGGMGREERAVEALSSGRTDLVAVGRGLIADAQWPIKLRNGEGDSIIRCAGCDCCFDDLRAGIPVGCAEWD